MNNKTLSIVSYITIIGWLISYFSYKDKSPKSTLINYHLKQSLGVAILGIVCAVVINIVAMIIPSLAAILSLTNIVILVLWIFGIINAMNEIEKPVPLVGTFFENKFDFIK
jgi:uncharacterized membrane protein